MNLRPTLIRSLPICLLSLAMCGCQESGTNPRPVSQGGSSSASEPEEGSDLALNQTPADSGTEQSVAGQDPTESVSTERASKSNPIALTSGESVAKAEPAGTGSLPASESDPVETKSTSAESKSAGQATGVAIQTTTAAVGGQVAETNPTRQFRAEGPHGALRITYDDLDLLKLLQMDPVTPDCVEKMPAWLRALDGKPVRLRGFMKPDVLNEGIRRFLFVKDTGLCCFGPAGKIYDLIEVTLKKGTSTKYIELRPFDVVGTFRIHVEYLDDVKEVYELFHIDDAEIIQK